MYFMYFMYSEFQRNFRRLSALGFSIFGNMVFIIDVRSNIVCVARLLFFGWLYVTSVFGFVFSIRKKITKKRRISREIPMQQ